VLTSPLQAGSFTATLAKVFEKAIACLQSAEYIQGARLLKGSGYGSTPSGNDFINGYLMALAWLEQGKRKNRLSEIADLILYEILGTDALCDAFAERSRALKPDSDWAELLLALSSPSADPSAALQAVLSHGATSGADALAGFFLGLRSHYMEVL